MYPGRSVTGRFVTGHFVTGRYVTGRFVGVRGDSFAEGVTPLRRATLLYGGEGSCTEHFSFDHGTKKVVRCFIPSQSR